jgi:hypothetical protein
MEEQYQAARDWVEAMGKGVLEHGEDITTRMTKMCPFYYQVDEIMRDHASIWPLALSESMENDEEEESQLSDGSKTRKKRSLVVKGKQSLVGKPSPAHFISCTTCCWGPISKHIHYSRYTRDIQTILDR